MEMDRGELKMIRWMKKGRDTCFFADHIQVARAMGREGCRDSFEKVDEGVFLWKRECEPCESMEMELRACYVPDFTMIPGVNYNGNGWGTFCEYTSDRYQGEPWKYGWHRAAVAAMTWSEVAIKERKGSKEEKQVIGAGLFGAQEDHNSCQLFEENGEEVHRICWPEQESPKTLYLYRFSKAWQSRMEPRGSFAVWIVIEENAVEKRGYARALDAAWKINDRPERKAAGMIMSLKEIWEVGIAYAKTLYTEEADGFCGFNIGLFWEQDGWQKRRSNQYEIGWCGQNGMLANALLCEALYSGDEEAKEMGFKVWESWLGLAKASAGVMASYYDPGQERVLEACNLGKAGIACFEAASLAEKLGRDGAPYRKAAMDICDFAVRVQDEKGAFAKCWHEDGRVAIREGTVGAFLVLPLIEGFKQSGKEIYKEAACRGLSCYLKELEEYGFTTAGALDIFSIDKESSIPLLKGAIALYDLTGEEKWLEGAKAAAWYLSTWQYTHTCHFGPESILGQTGYDSFGGTLVSTVHEGIDPFALCYIPELYRLFQMTGEERWRERARGIWRNGCQHISDGTLVINGKLRPKGSQDESYTVTRQGPKRGICSEWLVAWPGAFRMEVLRRLKEERSFLNNVEGIK